MKLWMVVIRDDFYEDIERVFIEAESPEHAEELAAEYRKGKDTFPEFSVLVIGPASVLPSGVLAVKGTDKLYRGWITCAGAYGPIVMGS